MKKDDFEFVPDNEAVSGEDDEEIVKYDPRDPNRDLYDENGNISQETYYTSDENGSFEGNVIFNEDGRPVDADGRVTGNDDDFAMFVGRDDDFYYDAEDDEDEDDDSIFDILTDGMMDDDEFDYDDDDNDNSGR